MKIQLEDYFIESDENCYFLRPTGASPKGEPKRPVSYHATIGQAVRALRNKKLLKSDCTNFTEVQKLLEDFDQKLIDLGLE